MFSSPHLEIICAQAQRFPQIPPGEFADLDSLRTAAAELSGALTVVPEQHAARFFARHWNQVKDVRRTVSAAPEISGQMPLSDEFRWLQENTHLLNAALQDTAELIKGAKKMPQVRTRGGAVVPRVLAVTEGYLSQVQYRFDYETFAAYLEAFQQTMPLNVREVWSLVLCLKLALLHEAMARALRLLKDPMGAQGVSDCIRSLHHVGQTSWSEVLEPLLVVDRILRQDPVGAYPAMDFGSRERYWNAVANIGAHSHLSEKAIALEALSLARFASSSYNGSDPRMEARRTHVGYYLVGEGAPALHHRVGFGPPLGQRLGLFLRRHPDGYYLSGIFLLTSLVIATVLLLAGPPGPLLLAALLLLLPASQAAVELMNSITTLLLPAQLLPKLDFIKGIPDDCATIVAVPALLLNEAQVRRLVEDLEVRYLGNRDRNLHFALLTDLPDSKQCPREDDPLVYLCAGLIEELNKKYAGRSRGSFLMLHRHRVYNPREGVWMGWERKRGKLMEFYKLLRQQYDAFPVKVGDLALLPRVHFVITLDADTELPRGSAHRMIGALAHPLNRAIIDPDRNIVVSGYGILQPRVGVSVQSAVRSRLASIYSGQTGLDVYTRAVSDVYQDLYGEGIFTGKGICEVDTILQVLDHRFPDNALLSHDLIEGAYARTGLASDIEVIDDYPSHYTAFNRRKHRWTRGDWQIVEWLLPRVPNAVGKRVPNPILLVSRWKILDNLRRSLVEPATLLLLVLAWVVFSAPGVGKLAWTSPARWTLAVIFLMLAPAWFHFFLALLRAAWRRSSAVARSGLDAANAAVAAVLLQLAFLSHQTLLSLDAIGRVMVRRLLTRRRLLEWQTAAEAELVSGRRTLLDVYLDWSLLMAAAVALLVWVNRPAALLPGFPILLFWACSKPIALWLNQPPGAVRYEMSADDRLLLRCIALRTWRYFCEWSNEEHHWLVPDNVQEDPDRVAYRTSPTDLGLLLNARQVACDLGYLTLPEFVDLTSRTLVTMEELPKHRGHLLNWYDTRTLAPLPPHFVSSADSGNLVAALWSLQQGCLERLHQPLLQPSLLEGLLDHLLELNGQGTMHDLAKDAMRRSSNWLSDVYRLADILPHEPAPGAGCTDGESRWFAEQACARRESVVRTVLLYCPWLLPEFSSLRDDPALQLSVGAEERPLGRLPAFIEAASARLAAALTTVSPEQQPVYFTLHQLLEEARLNTVRLIADLRSIADRAGQLAADMDFRFLFNRSRKLLSVGFDVESHQLHVACYDLLASEARMALFVAIGKEAVPQETWFLMGRSHALDNGRPALLSWTGTMFEYLMPCLWMRTYPNSLLERACTEAVRSQQAYAARRRIPWGISESAYARRDEAGNYQYRAFGLPALALHKDEMATSVISPYSTLLALTVDTRGALRNLRRMGKEGWLGKYGFYEAADYSSGPRSSRRHPYELIRCSMAHHQGMSLLAIANLLCDNVVQRWFHNNPRVQATALLLQERPVTGFVRRERQRMAASPSRGVSEIRTRLSTRSDTSCYDLYPWLRCNPPSSSKDSVLREKR